VMVGVVALGTFAGVGRTMQANVFDNLVAWLVADDNCYYNEYGEYMCDDSALYDEQYDQSSSDCDASCTWIESDGGGYCECTDGGYDGDTGGEEWSDDGSEEYDWYDESWVEEQMTDMAERLADMSESVEESGEYIEEAEEMITDLLEDQADLEEEFAEWQEDEADDEGKSARMGAIMEDALTNYYPVAVSYLEEWKVDLEGLIAESQSALVEMEDAYADFLATNDSETFWDLENSNPVYLMDIYTQMMQVYSDMGHIYKFLEEAARIQDELDMEASEINEKLAVEIEKANLALEVVPNLLTSTISGLLDDAMDAMNNGEEYWDITGDIWDEMEDIWKDYLELDWDVMEDSWEAVQMQEVANFKTNELESLKEEFADVEEELNRLEANGYDVAEATALLSKAYELVSELEAAEDWDDVDDVFDELDDLEEEFRRALKKLGIEDFGSDKRELYAETVGYEEVLNFLYAIPEDVLEQVIDMLLANMTQSQIESFIQYGDKFEDVGFFGSASNGYIDEETFNELIEQKLALLEELDQKIQMAQGKLRDLTNSIAAYNFGIGDASDQANELIAMLDSDLTDSEVGELEVKLGEIKEQAKEEKYEDGLIPYRDVDDNEWYTSYVWDLTNEGVVSGGTGENEGKFIPTNDVTAAEILKMALGAAGYEPTDGVPNNPYAQNHWSAGYFDKAEELGMEFVADVTQDPNQAATRAEVLYALFDAIGVSVPDATGMQFNDVGATHEYADFIQYAYELGIVSGDNGLGQTFRPDDSINRAETAKIVDQFMEIATQEGWAEINPLPTP